jgi:hypothetical protein
VSQAGIISTSGGPPPPTVATSYVTQNGTAVPAANILIVNAFDSTENNDNGIITKGGVVGTGTANEVDVIITNRVTGSITTIDAAQTAMLAFTFPTLGVYTFDVNIACFNTTDVLGSGFSIFFGVRSTGAAATLLNLEDKIINPEVGNTACDVSVGTLGNSVIIFASGIAGKTINWNAVGTYVFVGA